ncbi:MAG: cellulase family glycosylhydrolase [Bacteroidota bacterium]|nr:cellulase family glycosylhydrolase [Bacteroidota bacterium]
MKKYFLRYSLKFVLCFFLGVLSFLAVSAQPGSTPISLHPDNPRYFLFRGKPTILVTSGEHYGAVLNLDFDYNTYLNTLQADGLNYTRIFSGAYVEIPGAFDITDNTLAPAAGKFISPWQRSNQPGYFSGGNKFDLEQWDPAYFQRLRDFVTQAGKRGIVVEMTLFSSYYSDDKGWMNSPLNPRNNINNTSDFTRHKVQTLENGNLLSYQEKMVRKIVQELNGFDNVIFEIQNEPWSDNPQDSGPIQQELPNPADWQKKVEVANEASLAWQKQIATFIVSEESKLPRKHLIAQNISNFYHSIIQPDPQVSIFNFHYALPQAVWLNKNLKKVIGFDESGFSGNVDEVYRMQAWRFLLAGGGLFNNLDYSFTIDKEDGTAQQSAPGGGSPAFRKQLGILKTFLHNLPFIRMEPSQEIVKNNPTGQVFALAQKNKAYAVYLTGKNLKQLEIDLPAGNYQAEWINVLTGKKEKCEKIKASGSTVKLLVPAYEQDIALKILKL